jgi:hypothetical protein
LAVSPSKIFTPLCSRPVRADYFFVASDSEANDYKIGIFMTNLLLAFFLFLFMIWSISNLPDNQYSLIFVFLSFFSAIAGSYLTVRVIIHALEYIHFEAERGQRTVGSNRTRLREWSRPANFTMQAFAPVGKLRPQAFRVVPKSCWF